MDYQVERSVHTGSLMLLVTPNKQADPGVCKRDMVQAGGMGVLP